MHGVSSYQEEGAAAAAAGAAGPPALVRIALGGGECVLWEGRWCGAGGGWRDGARALHVSRGALREASLGASALRLRFDDAGAPAAGDPASGAVRSVRLTPHEPEPEGAAAAAAAAAWEAIARSVVEWAAGAPAAGEDAARPPGPPAPGVGRVVGELTAYVGGPGKRRFMQAAEAYGPLVPDSAEPAVEPRHREVLEAAETLLRIISLTDASRDGRVGLSRREHRRSLLIKGLSLVEKAFLENAGDVAVARMQPPPPNKAAAESSASAPSSPVGGGEVDVVSPAPLSIDTAASGSTATDGVASAAIGGAGAPASARGDAPAGAATTAAAEGGSHAPKVALPSRLSLITLGATGAAASPTSVTAAGVSRGSAPAPPAAAGAAAQPQPLGGARGGGGGGVDHPFGSRSPPGGPHSSPAGAVFAGTTTSGTSGVWPAGGLGGGVVHSISGGAGGSHGYSHRSGPAGAMRSSAMHVGPSFGPHQGADLDDEDDEGEAGDETSRRNAGGGRRPPGSGSFSRPGGAGRGRSGGASLSYRVGSYTQWPQGGGVASPSSAGGSYAATVGLPAGGGLGGGGGLDSAADGSWPRGGPRSRYGSGGDASSGGVGGGGRSRGRTDSSNLTREHVALAAVADALRDTSHQQQQHLRVREAEARDRDRDRGGAQVLPYSAGSAGRGMQYAATSFRVDGLGMAMPMMPGTLDPVGMMNAASQVAQAANFAGTAALFASMAIMGGGGSQQAQQQAQQQQGGMGE